ncbi:MAG: hypothetical protein R3E87_14560 [Burkholderiaceae bacterium]
MNPASDRSASDVPALSSAPPAASMELGDVHALLRALAHEMRTPLNALNGWFEILNHTQPPSGTASSRAMTGIERAIADLTTQLRELDGAPSSANPTDQDDGPCDTDFSSSLRAAFADRAEHERPRIEGLEDLPELTCHAWAFRVPHACRALIGYLYDLRLEVVLRTDPETSERLRIQAHAPAGNSALLHGLDARRSLADLFTNPRHLMSAWRTRQAFIACGIDVRSTDDGQTIEIVCPSQSDTEEAPRPVRP